MKVINRKFNREYTALEKFEAGIALTGAEVKSARDSRMRIDDAFVRFLGDEAFLINAEISVYPFAAAAGYDPKRSRKLLLHKKEMLRIRGKMASASGLTVAPVSCYNKGGIIKLEIALSKGKREIEKGKYDKEKTIKREEKREAKEYIKKSY